MEVRAPGSRDGNTFKERHLLLISLRTTTQALLQLVRDRWSIKGRRWIRDTQHHEDAHRYRKNSAGIVATMRSAALNLLRWNGFHSIRAGMMAVAHNIKRMIGWVVISPAETG